MLGKAYIPFRFVDRQVSNYLMAAVAMSLGVMLCMMIDNIWWQMLVATAVGAGIYFAVLYLRKDNMLLEMCRIVYKIKSVHDRLIVNYD